MNTGRPCGHTPRASGREGAAAELSLEVLHSAGVIGDRETGDNVLTRRVQEHLEEVSAVRALDPGDGKVAVGRSVQLVGRSLGIDGLDPETTEVLGAATIDRAKVRGGDQAGMERHASAGQQRFATEACRRAATLQRLDQLVPIHTSQSDPCRAAVRISSRRRR